MTLWEGRRVLLCVGTGGVGKTTTSAAIGLAAAATGLRTLVMTIDPARRLANALGLSNVGNVEHEISPEVAAAHGIHLEAPMWVMMPDVKRTFDELITRLAPSSERLEKIFGNRFYQQFSTALAGSLEYAAVEKLYEVYQSNRYDLIVLDTPPSQNANDFFQAPAKISNFLEHEALTWLLRPYALAGRAGKKVLGFGNSLMVRALSRLAGGDTIAELADFILGFQGMYEGFKERSVQVQKLLRSEHVSFVLVAAPQPNQRAAVQSVQHDLHHQGLRVRHLVVNRVRQDPIPDTSLGELERRVSPLLDADETRRVVQAVREEVQLAAICRTVIGEISETLGTVPITELPELPLEAHDLQALAALHRSFLLTV